MKGMSSLLQEYERNNLLQGIQVARGEPRITHMFFADDTYIFCKAKEHEAEHVLDLLNTFERASGQKINENKSSTFFSRNTDQGIRNVICSMMKFQEAYAGTKYLGLLNIIGRNKSGVLDYLKDRLRDRVQGWEQNYLSRGGKELLLKYVAQALLNYAINMFA